MVYAEDIELLPRPRLVRMLTGHCAAGIGRGHVRMRVSPDLIPHPQGYRLRIHSEGVEVFAHDQAGAFYARQTLKQLAAQSQRPPCMVVEDWPDFPVRGVMLDISRDRVPTMEALYGLVDLFASWKLNQFQLYIEHTFAYDGHEDVWRDASPMTGEEIESLDAYCRERFIDLVPNQNSFGHMHRWLEHNHYRHLAECPNGFPLNGRDMPPWTLSARDPGAISLIGDLYGQLLPHFSSDLLNVGCDETYDIGLGTTREICDRIGKGRVYLEFLQQLNSLARSHGRTTMYWADVAQKHPELILDLPRDAIAMNWGYWPSYDFDATSRTFEEAGLTFYVCPGVHGWASITGRNEMAMANIRSAAIHGTARGAAGFLNTDWGDSGHWQPSPVTYMGHAWGAAQSWCQTSNDELDVAAAVSRLVFKDPSARSGKAFMDLGNLYTLFGDPDQVQVLFKLLCAGGGYDAKAEGRRREEFEAALAELDRLAGCMEQSEMRCVDADLVHDEFRVTCDLARRACHLGIAAVDGVDVPTVGDLEARYRDVWLRRSRPGGLDDSVAKMNLD